MQLIGSSYTLILGLGIAGLSCARHLLSQGAPVALADTRASVSGLDSLLADFPDVNCRLGSEVTADWVAQASEIVLAPGLALDHPLVDQARESGVPVIGEVDLLRRAAPDAQVVAITGTNGKSTVTQLTGDMIAATGARVAVGGNLGRPMLDLLADDAEYLVIELSSFQLERAQSFAPRVATCLNMSPDHLDRHGDMITYYHAKHRIFNGADACVVNHDDALSRPLVGEAMQVVEFSTGPSDFHRFGLETIDGQACIALKFQPVIPCDQVPLVGTHNLANAMAAMGIVHALGLPMDAALHGLTAFQGLAHRMRRVAEHQGVLYVNDSKGTNEGASIAALTGLLQTRPGRVYLLVGGDGKGADFAALARAAKDPRAQLVGFGRDGEKIVQRCGGVQVAETLHQAASWAQAQATSGDSIVLSPACASFDQFTSFAHRGDVFEQWVQEAVE